jgi:hypothetical protein
MEPKVILFVQFNAHPMKYSSAKNRGIKTIPCVVKHNVTMRNCPLPKKKRKLRVHK